jgi:hypothetical protein
MVVAAINKDIPRRCLLPRSIINDFRRSFYLLIDVPFWHLTCPIPLVFILVLEDVRNLAGQVLVILYVLTQSFYSHTLDSKLLATHGSVGTGTFILIRPRSHPHRPPPRLFQFLIYRLSSHRHKAHHE